MIPIRRLATLAATMVCGVIFTSCSNLTRISAVERFQLLRGACLAGDERSVEILLSRGADPDGWKDWETDSIGGRYGDEFSSPMALAASRGHVAIIELLLKSGANIDQKEGEGDTPLSVAIWSGQKESVSVLIERGADPTVPLVLRSLERSTNAEIKGIVEEAIKKKPNQALQTTSVTRSGFGKVLVSDRQMRGV